MCEIAKCDYNWHSWCRLCAKDDPSGNINVFFKEEQQQTNGAVEVVGCFSGTGKVHSSAAATSADISLVKAIEKYFWVNISRTEELPKMLCTECLTLVTSLVNFSKRVAKVQQMFDTLQDTVEHVNLHAVRLRYGLLDEEREHVLMTQPMPEMHFFDTKPKIIGMEDKLFDDETDIANPLEPVQPRITIKIKNEHLMETEFIANNVVSENGDDCDDSNCNDGSLDYMCNDNDPFTDEADKDEDFKPSKTFDKDSSSNDVKTIKKDKEFSNLEERQGGKEMPNSNSAKKSKTKKSKQIKRYKRTKRLLKSDAETEDDGGLANDSNTENELGKDNDAAAAFACAECPSKFRRLQNFRLHMKTKHLTFIPLPQVNCPECPRVFTTQSQLEKHSKTHLPLELKKTCACPYCDKKFRWNTLVRTHIKHVHMNERPFICDECGVAVHTNAALKTHMLIHSDYAPFVCDVCQKRFKERSRLNLHMETHNKDNKHICAECGQQLNSRVTLNRHLLVHSDKMQHKCDYCGRAFKRAKALKNHLILHTGLKPFSCDFCDRTFADGSNCRSHKKKAHPEELAALEAAGGGKPCTRNIPRLQTLKAITKAADNLAPVASKQSGCFAFGKKPKMTALQSTTTTPALDTPTLTTTPATSSSTTTMASISTEQPKSHINHDFHALHSALHSNTAGGHQNAQMSSVSGVIPNIDNIYNHIMKQATIAAQNANAIESTYETNIREE